MCQVAYDEALKTTDHKKVMRCLTRIIEHFNGTPMRGRGGLYWIPEQNIPAFKKVSDIMTLGNLRNEVDLMRTAHDVDSVRAVCRGLKRRVKSEVATISKSLMNPDITDKAKVKKDKEAQNLYSSIADYKNMFGDALSSLEEVSDQADAAAVIEVLQAFGGE
jgi:hypothetical protein